MGLLLARTDCVRDGKRFLFAISKSTVFSYISAWIKTEKEIEKLKLKRNKNVAGLKKL